MSHLKTRADIWEEIDELGEDVLLVDPYINYKAWFKDQIEQRRGIYPCMADAQYAVSPSLLKSEDRST